MKRQVFLLALLVFLVFCVVFLACSKEEKEPQRPDVPSSATMTIDLSLFTSASFARPALRCAHFDTACGLVSIWGSITRAVFALPRLAFVLAITRTRVYEGDSTWSWTFGADTNNVKLTARLLASDSVEWRMTVTNSRLDRFLWYNGRCNFEATGGWWLFHDPALPADANDVLWTGWSKNDADTTAHLTLVIVSPTHAEFNDTLSYHVNGTVANVWLRDISGPRAGRWNIVWDRVAHYGRIEYPEGHSGCWDSALECTPCDSIPL